MKALDRHLYRRVFVVAAAAALAACALIAVMSLLPAGQARPALAQAGVTTITHTLVTDFNVCTVLPGTVDRIFTNTVAANTGGGEIRLAAFLEDYFDGNALNFTRWITRVNDPGFPVPWQTVDNGLLTTRNGGVRSVISVPIPAGRVIEVRARLQQSTTITTNYGDVGFGREFATGSADPVGANRLFATDNSNVLFANARNDGDPVNNTPIDVDLTQFHLYRIEWDASEARYAIDGVNYPAATFVSTFVYEPYIWLYTVGYDAPIDIDWVRVLYYPTTTGRYQSCAVGSGADSSWRTLSWTSTGTSASFETRSSRDAGATWTNWARVSGSGSTIPSPNGGYLQYRIALTTTDANASPEIQSVTIGYELNEPPIANAGGPYTASEGTPRTLNGSGSSDPNNDPLTYAWDFNYNGSTFNGSATGITTTTTFPDGPVTRTIALSVTDESGLFNVQSTTVTILNVAPTATFNAPTSLNEGSVISLSLTSALDPSSADTAAGFTYAFDCGDGSGYGSFGSSNTAACSTADNGVRTVRGQIRDKDNGTTEYTATVTVNNVAPTATFSASSPVNEGSASTLLLSNAVDPGPADTSAGLRYSFACPGGSLAANYGAASTSSSGNCALTTTGVNTVTGRIFDKDNGFNTYTATVTVINVPPTAATSGPYSGNEGSPIAFTGIYTDPGGLADSFTFRWSFGDGVSSTQQSPSHTYADSGLYTAVFTTTDRDGGVGVVSTTVTVNNVAPTAAFSAFSPVNEGGASALSLTNPSDPSPTDTTAGFRYSFACDGLDGSLATTYGGAGTITSTNCSLVDNGAYTVKARIFDKDDGFTSYTATVTVNNVAPTATFSASGPVNQGDASTLSLTSPSDPGLADTAAGFRYSFACPGGSLAATYDAASASPSANCALTASGVNTVTGRVLDKDNGFNTYTATVTVINVPPTAATSGPYSGTQNVPIAFTGIVTDPGGLADINTFLWDFGDGSTSTQQSPSHAYTATGVYTATFTITDKDGAFNVASTTVTVRRNVVSIPLVMRNASGSAGSGIPHSSGPAAWLNWLRQFMQRMNDIGGASHWRTVEAPTQVARRTT